MHGTKTRRHNNITKFSSTKVKQLILCSSHIVEQKIISILTLTVK